MSDRSGIFAGDDPFAILKRWLEEAEAGEPSDPNAMSLATVDTDGLPNVRVVLMKEIEADAIVFYTNFQSAKGQELGASHAAAVGFHWKSLRRQIRARGAIGKVQADQADAYYASRPLESRLGAWASRQSRPILSREALELSLRETREIHGDTPARPAHWGGYRLTPTEIEFWSDGAFRLHDRFVWKRPAPGADWTIARLNP